MTLDPHFAAGIREQLINTAAGTSPLAKRTHSQRLALGFAIGAGVLVLLTAGALVVATVTPGMQIVNPTGQTVTQTYIGSSRIDIGEVAANANAVRITIECTSSGSFVVTHPRSYEGADGVSWDCDFGAVGKPVLIGVIPLGVGRVDVQVTTGAATTWIATVEFVTAETTEWGVNANGQTYGVANNNGVPDLEAVYASNCEMGYIYSNHLSPGDPSDQLAIPVYTSDGVTVIGEFWIGSGVPFCQDQ